MSTERVICIKNDGFSDTLVVNSVYDTLPDDAAAKRNLFRVIDESGEDSLYPTDLFRSCAFWEREVQEMIEDHFCRAQESFDRKDYLQRSKTLADAVRTGLRYVAAGRGWPHDSDDALYRTAVALATGGDFLGKRKAFTPCWLGHQSRGWTSVAPLQQAWVDPMR